MDAASEVPSDFKWWVEFKNQVFCNELAGHVTGGNHNMGVHPRVLQAAGRTVTRSGASSRRIRASSSIRGLVGATTPRRSCTPVPDPIL